MKVTVQLMLLKQKYVTRVCTHALYVYKLKKILNNVKKGSRVSDPGPSRPSCL